MRAVTWPASFSTRKVSSTYSRVSTAFKPATTWKHSWSNATPLYSKRIGSSLPGRRPRIRKSPSPLGEGWGEGAGLLIRREPALAHTVGEDLEQPLRIVPTEARVRDGNTVGQRLVRHQVLA